MRRTAYILGFPFFLSALVFTMAPRPLTAQTYTESVLYAPSSISDGINIYAPVIQASDGNFYGIATASSLNNSTGSTIFQVNPSGKSASIYTFPTVNDYTRIGLIEGSDGNLYGVSTNGGNSSNYNDGLIFKVSPSGAYTLLYTFCASQDSHGNCVGGFEPDGVLVQGSDGNFYGTTVQGGASFDGTIFKITPSGNLTTIYNFCSQGGSACTDGMNPEAGLIQGNDGNFYGTTAQGGVACPALNPKGTIPGCGTVYRITPSGAYTVIHSFTGANDGAFPQSRLVQGPDGALYGTTNYGPNATYGENGIQGAVYKITTSGAVTSIYSISTSPEDGLVLGSDGNFYGTDYAGGTNTIKYGSVFQITASGAATVVYSFENSPDGAFPEAPPVQGADGNFYGTTFQGGMSLDNNLYDSGTVYKLAVSPPLQPPVALTLSSQNIQVGESATLNWSVANAYSDTLQQCYAFVQGAPNGAGTWTGRQTGVFDSTKAPPFSGSATITPTLDGTYIYALTCGGTESGFATLTVGTLPAQLSISTSSLPAGTAGTAYSQTLQASGGIAPYTWSITSGSLPAGLSLAGSTGVISGTPTTSVVSSFTVQAKDSESTPLIATAKLSITVNASVAPGFSISASGSPLTIAAGQSGTATITLTPVGGFSGMINLSCSGLPQYSTCSFSPATPSVPDGSNTAVTTMLTIATNVTTSTSLRNTQPDLPSRLSFPIYTAGSLASLVLLFGFRRRISAARHFYCGLFLFAVLAAGSIGLISGCGGGNTTKSSPSSTGPVTPTGAYTITVTASAATGGTQNASLALAVTQ